MEINFNTLHNLLPEDNINLSKILEKPSRTMKTANSDFEKDMILTVCSKNSKDCSKFSFTQSEDMNQLLTESLLNDTCPQNVSLPITEILKKLQNSGRTSKSKCLIPTNQKSIKNLKRKISKNSYLHLSDGLSKLKEPSINQSLTAELFSCGNQEKSSGNYLRNKRIKDKQELLKFWTEGKDQLLLKHIEEYGLKWQKISKLFNNKLITAQRVKNRYKNRLYKKNCRNRFTAEEDQTIINIYKNFGAKWQMVQELLPHRTENMIKNRFYGHIKKIHFPKIKSKKSNNSTRILIPRSLINNDDDHTSLFTNPHMNMFADSTDLQSNPFLFGDNEKNAFLTSEGSSNLIDPFKINQKNNAMFFEQENDKDDIKLSNCLDNLFKEISTDLQIEQKQQNQRTYINDEESIQTDMLRKQALEFLRDQKAVEDSEKIIKLQLLAKQMEMIEHLLQNTQTKIKHLNHNNQLNMQQALHQH